MPSLVSVSLGLPDILGPDLARLVALMPPGAIGLPGQEIAVQFRRSHQTFNPTGHRSAGGTIQPVVAPAVWASGRRAGRLFAISGRSESFLPPAPPRSAGLRLARRRSYRGIGRVVLDEYTTAAGGAATPASG